MISNFPCQSADLTHHNIIISVWSRSHFLTNMYKSLHLKQILFRHCMNPSCSQSVIKQIIETWQRANSMQAIIERNWMRTNFITLILCQKKKCVVSNRTFTYTKCPMYSSCKYLLNCTHLCVLKKRVTTMNKIYSKLKK